ncbi:MAG: DNA-directed RNA polymerase subunit beta, partial [Actinobacteria bacterium]|nr:DNA-directed RNA polymerase subunit beta [Actinomycetota bacterium]
MAASRTHSRSSTGPKRVSFAKIREPLEVPNLLDLQVESFDWLLGNQVWKDRVAAALESGNNEIPQTHGLQDVFEEISPIEDYNGTMSLTFTEPSLEDSKYTEDECREKDLTFSQPLYVNAEFMNNETGEIKSQTVFMGDFPIMTSKGTFIINGTERVVVSQLVRSPGVYFERSLDKATDKDVYT